MMNAHDKKHPSKVLLLLRRPTVLTFLILLVPFVIYHFYLLFGKNNWHDKDSPNFSTTLDLPSVETSLNINEIFHKNIFSIRPYEINFIHTRQSLCGDSRFLTPKEILPYGHVMRELAHRILSRDIAQSNVIIMSSSKNSSVISNFIKMANEERHVVHPISSTTIDHWWFSNSNRPKWVLLTIIDTDYPVFSSDKAANKFLTNGPTMTYIVLGIAINVHIQNITKHTYQYSYNGRQTIQHLLNRNYKVQLLSASDFWSTDEACQSEEPGVFLPNSLITHDNIDNFFFWGAYSAAMSRTLALLHSRSSGSIVPKTFQFQAYLFATQGLDLAIPSRREYLQASKYSKQLWPFPYLDPKKERHDMVDRVILKSCPTYNFTLTLKFRPFHDEHNDDVWDSMDIFCDERNVTEAFHTNRRHYRNRVRLWTSSMKEHACIKADCNQLLTTTGTDKLGTSSWKPNFQVSCVTRILPSKRVSNTNAAERPNILVILMDPISRAQFDFIMPKTVRYLEDRPKYVPFNRYTTVGNNSGPNQAALYAGMKLTNRDGISGETTWVWDKLNEKGYVTLKAEDGCIANSNMVQSMMPKTTHGHGLHELFCFHFARPNCIGSHLAADYLINHTKQFIETYEKIKQPWAAFLSLIDTHEDTMTLGKAVDLSLSSFLQWITSSVSRMDNTMVILISDHGLHYGPYFQLEAGKKERSQPVLYVRLPNRLERSTSSLLSNSDKWITAFDVHKTLLHIAALPIDTLSTGRSLLEILPSTRQSCYDVNEIPNIYCQIFNSVTKSDSSKAVIVPSLLSFYADIPRDHRWKRRLCIPTKFNVRNVLKTFRNRNTTCSCSTSQKDWYPCNSHPWTSSTSSSPNEYFSMVKCPGIPTHLETRVLKDDSVLQRLETATQARAGDIAPSILIIEVDSVSVAHADRHVPRTRKLLEKIRVSQDGKCRNSFCSVDFPTFAVVGPNSVSNQVASLSGCVTTLRHESCFDKRAAVGDICLDPSTFEFELELRSLGPVWHTVYCPVQPRNPFLYDIAKENGYVTFFGEEFCYPGSPWVVQDNVFDLKSDIHLDQIFCRIIKLQNPTDLIDQLYKRKIEGNCIDVEYGEASQKIGLDVLDQMWQAYRDFPKFAYLNSMAAHIYSNDTAKIPLAVEEYDVSLSKFLETFVGSDIAKNTIILIRSDHGLQGGDAATVDFSTQIEHIQPWTEVVMPKKYAFDNLLANSDKVVTPYDLYTMLKELITGRPELGRPKWRFNLLNDKIPSGLNCTDRKIPLDFCPIEIVRSPDFGVCNPFEVNQAVFCRDHSLGAKLYKAHVEFEEDPQMVHLHRRKGQHSNRSEETFNQSYNVEGVPCDNDQAGELQSKYKQIHGYWNKLDKAVKSFGNNVKLSGGLFLYPRQSHVFISVIRYLEAKLNVNETIRVCETGFGAGHSAALFLQASKRVEVVTFDKFDRSYQLPILQKLKNDFGENRIHHVIGDTCKTVPIYFSVSHEKRCDIIHGSSLCPLDMQNLIRHLRQNGIVSATAMNSLYDDSVYFGKLAQWRQIRDAGCISHIHCWKEEPRKISKTYVFAAKGSNIEHAFCLAYNTANCSISNRSSTTQYDHLLNFSMLCSVSSNVAVPD